jgi:hypothetical protein
MRPRLGIILAGVLMLGANLVAGALDWQLLHTRILPGKTGIPTDFAEFMQDAVMVAHQLHRGAVLPHDYLPYPPPFLLLTTPFSWLPPHIAYIAWLLAGNAALLLAARAVKLPWTAILLTLVSPADLFCMTGGQSGIFVSAALLLGFGLAETQPVLAGIAAGCTVIKPQLAILLPVCYLAARNWRGTAAAAGSVAVLCLLPTLIFGPAVWQLFFTHHVDAAQILVTGDWPQVYQFMMVTVFMACRSLHASLTLAAFIQAGASLAAAGAAWWLWQPERKIDRIARLAATLCLSVLVTPYAYVYDLPALTLAIAAYAVTRRPTGLAAITLFWLGTGFYCWISAVSFLTGAIFLAAVLGLVWPRPGRS